MVRTKQEEGEYPYRQMSLPREFVDELDRFVEAMRSWGFTSNTQVVMAAVRELYLRHGWRPEGQGDSPFQPFGTKS